MYKDPGKVVFAGIVICAVALGAIEYVSRPDDDDRSYTDDLSLARDGGAAHGARGDIVSGVVRSGAVESPGDSPAAVTDRSQASGENLLRDDVAGASGLLNGTHAWNENDDQTVALDLQMQADKESSALMASQAAKAAGPVDKKAARTASYSQGKSAHSRDTRVVTREHLNRVSSYAKNRHAPDAVKVTAVAGGYSARHESVPAASALARAGESADAPADSLTAIKAVERAPDVPIESIAPIETLAPVSLRQPQFTVQSVLSTPQNDLTAQALASPPLVQAMPVASVVPKQDDGSKSRAQVRADIVHAREDGSLPAFGNPDPAGPGGAPGLTGAPHP